MGAGQRLAQPRRAGHEPHIRRVQMRQPGAQPLAPAGEVGLLVREEVIEGGDSRPGRRRIEDDLDEAGERVVAVGLSMGGSLASSSAASAAATQSSHRKVSRSSVE